ncbi:MAG: hypothetical protein MJY95_03070 [Bacteroidaceae bacterium]|nr:hypothetical protein [Bacteroidaceae bacterium]
MAKVQRESQKGDLNKAFDFNIKMLKQLCNMYDGGEYYAALWIAVVLRTLLKDSTHTNSIFKQLELKDMEFIDTSFPINGCSGWNVGDGVHNLIVYSNNVFAGLLKKNINISCDKKIHLSFTNRGNSRLCNKKTFDDWYDASVFEVKGESEMKLSRKDVIETLAEKEGGAHFDNNTTQQYAYFQKGDCLKIIINDEIAIFENNPVFASVRQIAYEVLETIDLNN